MKLDMIVILAMIIKLAFHFMRVGIATDLSGRPMPSEDGLRCPVFQTTAQANSERRRLLTAC